MQQFMMENLLLAAASAVGGVILGGVFLRIVAVTGLNHFPRAYEVRVDGEVVFVAVLMALGAGALISFWRETENGHVKSGVPRFLLEDFSAWQI